MASTAFTHDLSFVTTAGRPTHGLLRLHGDLDCSAAGKVRRTLQEASAPDQVATVVVDLDGVTFINCVGLSPLLMAKQDLGDRLHFRGLPRRVRSLLSLTHPTTWMDPAAPGERPDAAVLDACSREQGTPCPVSPAGPDASAAEDFHALARPRRTTLRRRRHH